MRSPVGAWRGVGEFQFRTCFVAGTLVKTPSGYRNIEDIRAGDRVLSYNERTKRLEVQTVAQTFIRKTDRIYTLVYDTGTKLQTTATHPFYMEGKGWVKAADLHVGDDSLLSREVSQLDVYGGARLQNVSYRQSKQGVIVGITVEERSETVYNFEVNETHTYLVGDADVVVHNAGYATEASGDRSLLSDISDAIGTGIARIGYEAKGLWQRSYNLLRYGEFERGEFTRASFDSSLSSQRTAQIVSTLNNMTTSMSFRVVDGHLVKDEVFGATEKYEESKQLLADVFGDDAQEIVFWEKANGGSMHLTNEQIQQNFKQRPAYVTADLKGIVSRYDLSEKRSFITIKPEVDRNATKLFELTQDTTYGGKNYKAGDTAMLPLDNQEMNMLHELIHADRYRTGNDAPLGLSSRVPVYDIHGKPTGNYTIIPKEEYQTTMSESKTDLLDKSGKVYRFTENKLRAERGVNRHRY